MDWSNLSKYIFKWRIITFLMLVYGILLMSVSLLLLTYEIIIGELYNTIITFKIITGFILLILSTVVIIIYYKYRFINVQRIHNMIFENNAVSIYNKIIASRYDLITILLIIIWYICGLYCCITLFVDKEIHNTNYVMGTTLFFMGIVILYSAYWFYEIVLHYSLLNNNVVIINNGHIEERESYYIPGYNNQRDYGFGTQNDMYPLLSSVVARDNPDLFRSADANVISNTIIFNNDNVICCCCKVDDLII